VFGRRRRRIEVTVLGEYQLRTEILHSGTRSEGRVGRLYLSGREVDRALPGTSIQVDDVTRVVFLGDHRPHLWSVSGWAVESSDPRDDTSA
jgi:hypothetical protein